MFYWHLFITVPKPVLTGDPVSAEVGNSADLTCSVSSNVPMTTITYHWKRAGMTVATSAMYQVSSSVDLSDAGLYTCEVTVDDATSSPHVISGNNSVEVILTLTSK